MKATSFLRDCHARLQGLLARIEIDRSLRVPLVLQLVEELMTHLSIEENFFLDGVGERTAIHVEPYRETQGRVRNALLQAVFVEADDEAFAERLRELRAEMNAHRRSIEHDLLPLVEAELAGDDLERIGNRMHSFWTAAVGIPAPDPQTTCAAE